MLMNAQRDELEDYGTDMQNLWEGGLSNRKDFKPMQFDAEGIPLLDAYTFGRFFLRQNGIPCFDTVRREKQQIYGLLIFTLAPERCKSSSESQWVSIRGRLDARSRHTARRTR